MPTTPCVSSKRREAAPSPIQKSRDAGFFISLRAHRVDMASQTIKPTLDLTFPHSWTIDVLEKRPLIAPLRQFVYPQKVEEVERGALELLIKPATGDAFLATCALGFADPTAPTGIWSCPNPDWISAAS